MSGPYGDAAYTYWDAGWRGVLHLPPRAKKNPPGGFTGEDGTDPSYADVHAWSTGPEGAGNICLRLPRNVIGIDVDNYGDKLGAATFAAAVALLGELPPTWRTTSRDDGVSGIRLYRVPEGLAWPGEIGPGTELIQWRHRYAVVAPSVHPDTGGTYRWINPAGLVSTIVPDPDELPALPDAWVERYTGGHLALDTHRDERDQAQAALWVATLDGAGRTPCKRMGKVIEQARKDLLGSAHNAARDGALRAVRLGSEGHQGAVEVLRQVRDMFLADATSPNRDFGGRHRRTPREADREWADVLTSATNLVTANPSPALTCDCEGQITSLIVGSASAAALVTDGTSAIAPAPTELRPDPKPEPAKTSGDPRLLDGAAFILDVPDTVPAVWGDKDGVLWAEGEALMLVGPPGVGKTTLTGQILAGLIYGSTVLGLPVRKVGRRILYLAMDRPQQIARSLARTFTEHDREALTDHVRVWQGPPPADIARNPDILVALATLADAEVIIIDSVKDAAVGLTEDEIGAGYNRARQTALAAGVQMLELHHLVKRGPNGTKPNTLADVYGSVWLTAGAGSVALLWGQAGDLVVDFIHLKQPAAEVGPWKVVHDHELGRTTVMHGADLVVVVAAQPEGMTIKEVAVIEFEAESPSPNEIKKTQRRLDKLVTQGHLTRIGGSRGGSGEGRDPAVYRAVTGLSSPIPKTNPANPGANPAAGPLKGGPGAASGGNPAGLLDVACKRCFTPTPDDVADVNDGLCEYCAHGRFES